MGQFSFLLFFIGQFRFSLFFIGHHLSGTFTETGQITESDQTVRAVHSCNNIIYRKKL